MDNQSWPSLTIEGWSINWPSCYFVTKNARPTSLVGPLFQGLLTTATALFRAFYRSSQFTTLTTLTTLPFAYLSSWLRRNQTHLCTRSIQGKGCLILWLISIQLVCTDRTVRQRFQMEQNHPLILLHCFMQFKCAPGPRSPSSRVQKQLCCTYQNPHFIVTFKPALKSGSNLTTVSLLSVLFESLKSAIAKAVNGSISTGRFACSRGLFYVTDEPLIPSSFDNQTLYTWTLKDPSCKMVPDLKFWKNATALTCQNSSTTALTKNAFGCPTTQVSSTFSLRRNDRF